ncbi:HlyD family secretion protein [Rhodospirillaceae bacterium LM-1]|nr:HlyD family secretion protein [Rhodospirillaceae bacterium LM-1]
MTAFQRKLLYGAIAAVIVLAVWWYAGGPSLFGTSGAPQAPVAKNDAAQPAAKGAPPAPGPGGPAKPVAVEAMTLAPSEFIHEVSAVGSLLSNESVMIRPEMAGRVIKILFEEGTAVKKGQPLVKLDDSTYVADYNQARANLDLSKANNERATKLYSQGAGTARALDEAGSKLKVDQSRIELAKTNMDKTLIMAPFDGVVGLRKVSLGAYVTPGQDLVNLEGIDPIKADFQVPEIALSEIKPGMPILVRADSYPGKSFTGEVYAIDPKIDPVNRSVAARARLPNAEGLLKPGMFVRIGLVTRKTENALMLSEEALIPRGNQMFVYKIVDGLVVAQKIRTGARREGKVEIVEGLASGDVVITAGHMKVREGAPVVIAGQDKKP